MGLFNKLFGRKETEQKVPGTTIANHHTTAEKELYKVYPRLMHTDNRRLELAHHQVLAGDLALAFVQDIDDRITYILKEEADALAPQIHEWKQNIKDIPVALFTTDTQKGEVYYAEAGDYSIEKIFDPAFIDEACTLLNTDKIIISIARRHSLQCTSFYNEFADLEIFMYSHFCVWRDESNNDAITEQVLVAEKGKGLEAVYLGYRMQLYEKNGSMLLSYVMVDNDLDSVNFKDIYPLKKQPVNYQGTSPI